MTPGGRGLGIFYKEPRPGSVKTRLTPPLQPEEAAELYAAFLSDTIRMVSREPGLDLVILFDADVASSWRPEAPPEWLHRPQVGTDLGERMAAALAELIDRLPAEGRAACLIGSDAPFLDGLILESAFHALESGHDLVTSPTPDGGYGLIGVSAKPANHLLAGIAWSTENVLAATEAAAHRIGWSTGRTLPSQDIDTGSDLSNFLTLLSELDSPSMESMAPATRHYLAGLIAAGRLAPPRQ
ncbi:MAG: hypothetical protein FD129_466 [bacterium]|nr:MAG: hypothetical protein FD129_466 [bacterium]